MKRILPFFIILSFTFPLFLTLFLHFYPFVAFASDSDSVSSDDVYIKWEKDNVDAIRNGLASRGTVVNPDFYLVNSDTLNPNMWEYIAAAFDIDYELNLGKPLPRVIYDYTVSNNITNNDIYNDCFNTIYNNLNDFSSYVIYQAMPVSYFFNNLKYAPSLNSNAGWTNFKNNLTSLVNSSDAMFLLYFDSWAPVSNTSIISISSDVLDNYSFCLNSGSLSNWQNYDYQTYSGFNVSLPSDLSFSGTLGLFDNNGRYSGNFGYSRNNFNLVDTGASSLYGYFALGLFNNAQSSGSYTRFQGTPYLVPDSWGAYSFSVFKSFNLLDSFLRGDSFVYKFDPDIDISKYGSDLDLDQLYDVISDSVGDAEGNIIASINRVANNYLRDQVQLLGDIKNALNDSFGNSWLRRIYNLLDDRLDNKISDVIEAIENISISGGGSSSASPNYSDSLTNINNQLTNIQGYLLFLSAEELLDDIRNDPDFSADLSDVSLLMQTKFPFCIPTDLVTILALFDAEPVEPEFYVPIPLTDNEKFLIDFSFYEQIRPVVESFLVISFIIMLSVLSAKIIKVIRGG